METGRSMPKTSGAPSARSMLTSLAVHVVVMAVLMLVPAHALLRSEPPKREVDVVFYRPPEIEVRPRAIPLPAARGTIADGRPPGAPAPARNPKPNMPPGPDGPGKPELPRGPEEAYRVD